jgi:hypothetical protein
MIPQLAVAPDVATRTLKQFNPDRLRKGAFRTPERLPGGEEPCCSGGIGPRSDYGTAADPEIFPHDHEHRVIASYVARIGPAEVLASLAAHGGAERHRPQFDRYRRTSTPAPERFAQTQSRGPTSSAPERRSPARDVNPSSAAAGDELAWRQPSTGSQLLRHVSSTSYRWAMRRPRTQSQRDLVEIGRAYRLAAGRSHGGAGLSRRLRECIRARAQS